MPLPTVDLSNRDDKATFSNVRDDFWSHVIPALLLHASAARVESKHLQIRLVGNMGPGVWENERGGAIRVLQAFRQPNNSSTLF